VTAFDPNIADNPTTFVTAAVESGTERVDMRTAEVGSSAARIPQVLKPSRDVQNRTPPIYLMVAWRSRRLRY
jgi:hypothetical protein